VVRFDEGPKSTILPIFYSIAGPPGDFLSPRSSLLYPKSEFEARVGVIRSVDHDRGVGQDLIQEYCKPTSSMPQGAMDTPPLMKEGGEEVGLEKGTIT
jgi:hypothetical protein